MKGTKMINRGPATLTENDTKHRRSPWRNAVLVTAAGACLLGGLAASWAIPRADVRYPISRGDGVNNPDHMQRGGAHPDLELALVPDAILKNGSAERIEYHVEIASNHKADGAVAWSAVVVDDLGTEVQNIVSGAASIASKAQVATQSFAPTLPDGDYAIRVRGVLVAPEYEVSAEGLQPIRVRKGVTRELSLDDWFTNTRLTLAVPAPSDKGASP
jgi:hypothetical protein